MSLQLKIIKYVSVIFISLTVFNAFSQPFVLSCNLKSEFIRDKIVDKDYTGIWCDSCAVAIKVEERNILSLDNVGPGFSFFYNTNNKVDLDSNGFGKVGTWTIDKQAIKAYNKIYQYGKNIGFVSLDINRLTGRFYATSTVPNPIGNGLIQETLSGACRAQQAAF